MKLYWQIWGIFRGFWTPFGGTQQEFFRKKFYSAQLDMKRQLVAKLQKKLMDSYPALVRTGGRVDGRTGLITIVPFRLKSGD